MFKFIFSFILSLTFALQAQHKSATEKFIKAVKLRHGNFQYNIDNNGKIKNEEGLINFLNDFYTTLNIKNLNADNATPLPSFHRDHIIPFLQSMGTILVTSEGWNLIKNKVDQKQPLKNVNLVKNLYDAIKVGDLFFTHEIVFGQHEYNSVLMFPVFEVNHGVTHSCKNIYSLPADYNQIDQGGEFLGIYQWAMNQGFGWQNLYEIMTAQMEDYNKYSYGRKGAHPPLFMIFRPAQEPTKSRDHPKNPNCY